jgi:hypothetical protein
MNIFTKTKDANTKKGEKNKRKNKINNECQFLINPILKNDLKKKPKN